VPFQKNVKENKVEIIYLAFSECYVIGKYILFCPIVGEVHALDDRFKMGSGV
jgi:hypothetical protein